MNGKEKCRLLREIRKELAEKNGIPYVVEECTYQGEDCAGTCPKCDAEIAWLESEMRKKMRAEINAGEISDRLRQAIRDADNEMREPTDVAEDDDMDWDDMDWDDIEMEDEDAEEIKREERLNRERPHRRHLPGLIKDYLD